MSLASKAEKFCILITGILEEAELEKAKTKTMMRCI